MKVSPIFSFFNGLPRTVEPWNNFQALMSEILRKIFRERFFFTLFLRRTSFAMYFQSNLKLNWKTLRLTLSANSFLISWRKNIVKFHSDKDSGAFSVQQVKRWLRELVDRADHEPSLCCFLFINRNEMFLFMKEWRPLIAIATCSRVFGWKFMKSCFINRRKFSPLCFRSLVFVWVSVWVSLALTARVLEPASLSYLQ